MQEIVHMYNNLYCYTIVFEEKTNKHNITYLPDGQFSFLDGCHFLYFLSSIHFGDCTSISRGLREREKRWEREERSKMAGEGVREGM